MPRPAPPKELDDLSEREREVVCLIARGLSNGEIAQEPYISETTVKTHITHILQKLNLRDRVQAVVLAYQTGSSRRTCSGKTVAVRARLAESLAHRILS
jgi:DNA-binding NarL/FixJ family response regulator